MTEKLLVVAFSVGLPILVGLITKAALKYDVIIRIWPPSIKFEKNGY